MITVLTNVGLVSCLIGLNVNAKINNPEKNMIEMTDQKNALREEQHDDLYRMTMLRVAFIFIVLCAVLFLLLFQSADLFNPHRYILRKVLSLGHIPLFGLVAWAVLLGINIKIQKVSNWPIWSYLAALILTFGFGFLVELAQALTPTRDASVRDLICDTLGAVFLLSFTILWINEDFSQKHSKVLKFLRSLFIVLFVVLSVFLLRPLVYAMIDENQKKQSFPMISSFENEGEIGRWEGGKNDLSISRDHADDGKYSLKAVLYPAKYSGISMFHPPRDWRGFSQLEFTIFNPSKRTMSIVLKILDWDHTYDYNDRYNKSIRLVPGGNRISIPLQEIESAPATRKMRMDRIGQISFFIRGLKEEQVMFFDNIRLTI